MTHRFHAVSRQAGGLPKAVVTKFFVGSLLLTLCLICIAASDYRTYAADPAEKAAADKTVKEIPKPEDLILTTQDKVTINAVYYGSNLGKKAVPIILLHGYKGSHADFTALALSLQKAGHAVVVPDLRGHGKSTKVAGGRDLDAASLKKNDFAAMLLDIEAVKDFLLKKNNEGELNIEKLCVVGSELGATLAIKYASYDWHWPQLIGVKQGRDVKAVVMISPDMDFKGLNMKDDIADKNLQSELSIMVLVGDQSPKNLQDAKRINQQLERLHPDPPADSTPEQRSEKRDYYFIPLKTNLQGTKLLGANLNVEEFMNQFVERRLSKKPFAWTDRTSKL